MRLTPSFVARLKCLSHDLDIARAVESEIRTTAISHLDQLVDDTLAVLQLRGVDKVGRSEFFAPLLLVIVRVDGNDLACLARGGTLNDCIIEAVSAESNC